MNLARLYNTTCKLPNIVKIAYVGGFPRLETKRNDIIGHSTVTREVNDAWQTNWEAYERSHKR